MAGLLAVVVGRWRVEALGMRGAETAIKVCCEGECGNSDVDRWQT